MFTAYPDAHPRMARGCDSAPDDLVALTSRLLAAMDRGEMSSPRRTARAVFLLGLTLALLFALCLIPGSVAAESAEGYPKHSMKLIVPFPPGGPTDIVARPFAEALSQSLGQAVVIENRGGAGGSIGAAAVVKAPADGYTLLLGTVGVISINPSLYPRLSYDPRDLTPVALLAAAPVALVAHPSVPASDVAGLRSLAARQDLRFGSAGNGTPGHLTGEMFGSASGIPLTHVPYKGSAPAVQDLLGGHLELAFDPLQSVLPHIRAGKLKALGVSSAQPAPELPGVPTFLQSGVQM
ncbi:MAG: tripartite tricarboxylate transporter substrate binding protein, partial [Zoogloeaceae bacterium]|nr:tripartite tricarboxylate transporter substrate binding protein [Zoogloeaceae bacterium]